MSMQIRRLSYALGAEISGIDISKPLDDNSFTQIYSAFLEHGILLFRGQPLTREQHIAFSRRFGELEVTPAHRVGDRDPDFPEIVLVTNKPKATPVGPADKRYQGEGWHSDRSFSAVPAQASLLRGVTIPDIGGDTMFSNCYRAYDTLSEGMKRLLEGLHAAHIQEGSRTLDYSTPERLAETQRATRTAHPMVRVHPDTGRKSLYLGYRVKTIVGMTAEESRPLLQLLIEHATRPQFIYRHIWQKDDLMIWDNRCTLHNAVNDYDRSQLRHMERATVRGVPSGYPYEGPVG